MQEILGRVRSLWRYPVKSMLGTPARSLVLDERGVEGDRLFALRTSRGKFGSGKDSTRFEHIPGLLQFRASYSENVPVVSFPNGRVLRGDAPEFNNELSAELGTQVCLAREAEIAHLDAGPIHLFSSASLHQLASNLELDQVAAERFRPNILLELEPGVALVNQWQGMRLQLGEDVQLTITGPTERCVMTSQAQLELPKQPKILKHLVRHCQSQFGMYAEVSRPGILELNAAIKRL